MTNRDDFETETADDVELFKTTGRDAPTHGESDTGDASAEELIECIQAAREGTDAGSIWTSDMTLPGFGDTQYDDCGDDLPRFCTGCADDVTASSVCYKSTCGFCAPSWARRRASHVVSQLEQLRRYRADFKSDHQRFHHCVVSPPADFHPDGEDQWEEGLKVVKRILKAADMEGYVFYHPFRGSEDGEDDRGEWARRLFSEHDWDEVRDELRFAPHYHLVVVGHEFPGGSVTKAVESETGWVLHRILKKGSNVSIYDHYDLARAVSYCLSHTGLYETEQQTRAAHRPTGANLTQNLSFDPDENDEDARLFRQADAKVRSVAPKTLGLPYSSLACTEQHTGDECDCTDAEEVVSQAQAEAARTDHLNYDPRSLDGAAGDGEGQLGDDGMRGMDGTTDNLDADDLRSELSEDQEDDPEACGGRLVSMAKAPAYLEDDDWRESAPYADELAEVYEDWCERLDWLG
jgi:hypothetical protein